MFLVLWCDHFQQGIYADVGCDNGNEKIYSGDQLEDAKLYCEQKVGCLGVLKHPDGRYTPRCGNMRTSSSASWLNKDECNTGNIML